MVVLSALVAAAVVVADNGSSQAPVGGSTARPVRGSGAAQAVARERAAGRAQSLLVTRDILPAGFENSGGSPLPTLSQPAAASPCTPVTSAPWLATAVSDRFVSREGGAAFAAVFSEAFVMPTAAVASSSWQAVAAPEYGPSCVGPALAAVAAQVVRARPPGPCQLDAPGSLSQPSLGGILPPATLYRYQASASCGTDSSRPVYLDAASIVAARTSFLQVFFFSATQPPSSSTEEKVLSALHLRGRTTPAPAA